jgi:N-acyl homoserine lactone hydrolase
VRQKAGSRGIRRYVADAWRTETLPVHAFLVEHPKGLVLFDAGQTVRAAEPGWFPRWHPFFRLSRFELEEGDEVAQQIHAQGIETADVRFVILSHLHTDHVGGLAPFDQATVLVSRLEWTRATGVSGLIRGYLPQHWPSGLAPTLVDFTGPSLGPFSASFDVIGDGSLLLVPTPGHTAGHAALLVRGSRGSWLLAGDMAHSASELAATDPGIAAWCETEAIAILAAHDSRLTTVIATA